VAANPFDILKQLQDMQSRVGDVQEKLRSVRVTGSAGGGMVTVEMNGAMQVEQVTIAPDAVDPRDVPMLQDLVRAAFGDAMERMKEKIRDEMAQVTGGLGLPPGLLGF
jgi:DNA-binding YbaB/EbfC family protein